MGNPNQTKNSAIKEMLRDFCSSYFDDELKEYSFELLETIHKIPLLDLGRGKSEIWAASIVYVISRLNFLFDKDNNNYISVDELCNYFKVKKSTAGNKASQIEKVYNISLGDKKYTKPEISKMFEYYITSDGIMIPAFVIDERDMEERRQKEEQARRAEINRQKAAEKKKKREAGQYNLFDDPEK